MQQQYHFAVDLGATSGRTIIGAIANGKLQQEELTRFDNSLITTGGHVYWDIFALYQEIIKGLTTAAKRQLNIVSIGIDTWGVDFVLVGEDDAIMRNPLSYRDPYTIGRMEEYLEQVCSRQQVYETTGTQFMNFNSLFQLYAMRQEGNVALSHAKKILFIPDALTWMLTGTNICERTIASTSQMLNPRTGDLDPALLETVALQRKQFGDIVEPGTIVGHLTEEVQHLTGLGSIPVVAVAGHDTASAVAAVPATDKHFAYLSSGTWSLMGIETPEAIINEQSQAYNFTNEGGIEHTTRFLKNICGMWLYERCRKEWGEEVRQMGHAQLQALAMKETPFRSLINPDDTSFANPTSMTTAIQEYCHNTNQPIPQTPAEICRCIFDSLALRYRQVFGWLKDFATSPIHVLHIIGGGSLNKHLNQMTANAIGIPVIAGPQEGTAIGNIMMQAQATGGMTTIWEMRRIIADSIEMQRYEPKDKDAWDAAYSKFLKITKQQ